MEFKIETHGFKEILEQLDTFCSPALQIKLVQNAVKTGIKPVKEDAERRLGRGRGYIATGIPKRRGGGTATIASIGLGLVPKHWPLVFREYGTKERIKGHRRGRIIAKPFIRPALDSQKNNVLEKMRTYLELAFRGLFEGRQRTVPEVKGE